MRFRSKVSFTEIVMVSIVPLILITYGTYQVVSWKRGHDADDAAEQRRIDAPVPAVVLATPPPPAMLTLPPYPANDLATTWPRACDLITAADLRAALPQVTGVVHTGAGDTKAFGTRTVGPAGVTGTGRRSIPVPESICDIGFDLPHKTFPGEQDRIATVTVGIEAFGAPGVVAEYARARHGRLTAADKALRDAHGAWACADERCTKGPLTVTVAVDLHALDGDNQQLRMPDQAERGDDTAGRFAAAVQPVLMGHLLDRIPA